MAFLLNFSKSLRNLGIIFDNSFSLHQHIMNTCRAGHIELRRISSIWHFLSMDATKTSALKFRYCNSQLSGSPQYLIQLFQKVQIQLLGLHLEPEELNILHPSFGCLYNRESSTKSVLFVMLHWLAQVQSMSELVNVSIPSRCLRSLSNSRTLTIPYVKTKSGNLPSVKNILSQLLLIVLDIKCLNFRMSVCC